MELWFTKIFRLPRAKDVMGHVRLWHDNGQLSYEATYIRDNLDYGLMTEYDKEGNNTKQERYEDGELVKMIK